MKLTALPAPKAARAILICIGAGASLALSGCGGGSSGTPTPMSTPTSTPTPINTPPLIIGYYTNWSTYGANYQPADIPAQVAQVDYAFAQIGECNQSSLGTEASPQCNPQILANTGPGTPHPTPVYVQSGVQDYQLHTTDPYSDFYSYYDPNDTTHINMGGKGNIAKALATGKQVMLSIGGYSLSAPMRTAISPANEPGFTSSIIKFLGYAQNDAAHPPSGTAPVTARFAGVDIDWEPNGNQWTQPPQSASNVQVTLTDLQNFYAFLADLKSQLATAGYPQLSMALSANPAVLRDVDSTYGGGYWKKIAALGVKLHLMTYDYNAQAFAGSCTVTEFNAPLQPDPANPCAGTYSVQQSVQALTSLGVPASSIGIGIPAYGYAYSLSASSAAALSSSNPYVTFSPGSASSVDNVAVPALASVWTYRSIVSGRGYGVISSTSASENTNWSGNFRSSLAEQVYASGLVGGTAPAFISYSDYGSARNLMTWAQTQGLASVMVWSLDQDVQPGDVNVSNWAGQSIVAGLAAGVN